MASGTRVSVLGAGSWGTALAVSLSTSGHDVALWARRPEHAEDLSRSRVNEDYLPDTVLPDAVRVVADIEAAVEGSEFWVIATPAQTIRHVAERLVSHANPDLVVVSVAKGIEQRTLLTTTQVLDNVLIDVPTGRIGVLSGPSHAEEVAQGLPTTVVAAAPEEAVAERIQSVFMTESLRVYVNLDVLGVEIAGAVKNVMAIAAGISEGVGYGDNAKAAIVTRGIAEMTRLGVAMGAQARTFSGLTGIGDLVVTCMSRHSRNRFVGEQIGLGRPLKDILQRMHMVAEGVATSASTVELASRNGVVMPITQSVYEILFEGKKPRDAVRELMTRAAKKEDWLATGPPCSDL